MTAKIIDFNIMGDKRGSLIALEQNHNTPFDIKRVYYIFGTKKDVRRGFHAHKNLKQLAICVSGSCKFLIDNSKEKKIFSLDTPNKGLLLDGLLWREMYDFSDNCVLMVIASEYYNENDYIREYASFLRAVDEN